MSKRLQVVVEDAELRRFQRAAKSKGVTLSEWARQVLRRAERESSSTDPTKKLDAIRNSVDYAFPAPDIRQMEREIERAYQNPAHD